MNGKQSPKTGRQLVWGIALLAVGIGVFVRTPQVMPRLQQIHQAPATLGYIRFCFYLIGFILVGGGIKKIVHYFYADRQKKTREAFDTDDLGPNR
jgi:Ni,Fe-hydrogenase I cytochrome b subunit